MTSSFVRLMMFALVGSCLVPLVTTACSSLNARGGMSAGFLLETLLSAAALLVAVIVIQPAIKRMESLIDADAREQAVFLDSFSGAIVDLGILGAAALSLFMELAVIRWQSTVFEFFAFYKNFGLLSCFAGLGLGYALASRERIPLALSIPLFGWQFGLLIALRFGMGDWRLASLRALPFPEQLNMGIKAANFVQGVALYFFLSVIFLLTLLAFIPIGQLCGRLMEQREKLRAYGLNLLGSLLGVLLMFLLSWLWTPPLVWFALSFGCLLFFYSRRQASLLAGAAFTLAAIVVLAWPVDPWWQKIYSPYQLIELGRGERGLMRMRAAGHYYQRVHDLSDSNLTASVDPNLKSIRNYYGLPYKIYPDARGVAVVGAGAGNDVAAALRSGVERVDAIEIDPAILLAGQEHHPERPYNDPRVRAIVNDARSFLRTTDRTYDMVVYGLLDSHTLLSHASSVRLDSFVYTTEALREARARIKPGGVLFLSFCVLSDQMGRKIYKMMQEAFDGRPPLVVVAGYDYSIIFMQSTDKDLVLPPGLLQETGFEDKSSFYANPNIEADVSTDDWPFFYMSKRIYPVSYLVMLGLMLVLSFRVTSVFSSESPRFSRPAFFFLGVGFMLVETKGITEMGLTFGNTWQVIGIAIAGILMMAFLANCVVQWLSIRRPLVPYLLLLSSLAFGWLVARGGGLTSTALGRLGTVILLTCPIFFSGIAFSTLLASRGQISGIMAMNMLGAMLGGLLEYNSMYFGFQFLYLLAAAFYFLALVSDLPSRKTRGDPGFHLPQRQA